jgi:hypothetical protein
MLPNFLIAGVSRSGTTSLYHYLQQHPEVSFPELKEPRYFSSYKLKLPQNGPGDFSVDEKLIKSFNDYNLLYDLISNKFIGDASSEYLYNYEVSIPEIIKRLGDIPIVLILRNPIDRSLSAYHNLIRDGREHLNFDNALDIEEERIKLGYDEMWHYKNVSLYAKPVAAFLKSFSKVKVLIFEEFICNEKEKTLEVLDFIGANTKLIDIDTSHSYSKSGVPKSKLIPLLFGRKTFIGNNLRKIAFKLLGRNNIENISKYFLSDKKEISLVEKQKLNLFFKDDIEELEKILQIKLDIWKIKEF